MYLAVLVKEEQKIINARNEIVYSKYTCFWLSLHKNDKPKLEKHNMRLADLNSMMNFFIVINLYTLYTLEIFCQAHSKICVSVYFVANIVC